MSHQKRVLFLDIDGVLNSTNSACASGESFITQLSPISVLYLHRLVLLADAELVISSTWRRHKDYRDVINDALHAAGWPNDNTPPIIGRTTLDSQNGTIRGDEVQQWLGENRPDAMAWDDYICIDDNSDFHAWQPLILTDANHGLTHIEYAKILRKWNVPMEKDRELVYEMKTTITRKRQDYYKNGKNLW